MEFISLDIVLNAKLAGNALIDRLLFLDFKNENNNYYVGVHNDINIITIITHVGGLFKRLST